MNASIMRNLSSTVLMLSAVVPAHGRIVELTLSPTEITESARKHTLLPRADRLADDDAAPLYEEAIQLMPKGDNQRQVSDWLKLPIDQFPQQQADQVIQTYLESLRLVARAARCKQCNWPEPKLGRPPGNLAEYRRLAFIIALWARLETSRDQFKGSLAAMQTGFAMARDIGQGPDSIQALVGSAIGGLMCNQVEQFIQRPDAPNLYAALQNLPRPLVDMDKSIEQDMAKLKDYDAADRKEIEKQLKQSLDGMRMNEKKANARFNALQVVEVIRYFAATHNGQLPRSLGDINDRDLPKDPISGKAFEYRHTGTGATLRSAIPEGGSDRDAVHYQIVLSK